MKRMMDWQWPGAMVFAVVFMCMTFLVWKGVVTKETLELLLTWLIPSPIQILGKDSNNP